jgi:glycosyltransferase 2 family protein
VNLLRRIWKIGWRAVVGGLLLAWICHSIFVNEARLSARQGRLLTPDGQPVQWDSLPRSEQWSYGWRHGPPALWRTLRSIPPGAGALSVVLMGTTLLIGMARWRMVLRLQGLRLSLGRATEISLVAHFFNSFLLGTAGGDLMKAYYAARETQHKKPEAVVTVFVDRLIGLWAMLLFAAAMIFPNHRLFAQSGLRTATALVVMMLGVASAAVFLAFRGGLSKAWSGARTWLRRLPKGAWLERSLDSCRLSGRAPWFLTRALGYSMLLNLVCVLQFWVIAQGLRIDVSLRVLCLVVPMIICIAALPITPSGLGVRENLFVQLLAAPALGVPATLSLSLSLLAYAGSLFWSLVGGGVYVMFRERHHLDESALEGETNQVRREP